MQHPTLSRRRMMAASAATLGASSLLAQDQSSTSPASLDPFDPLVDETPLAPGTDYDAVHTPNGATLPFRIVDGVKVFHLVAQEFEHEFLPGLVAKVWGYNGRTPGPTIECVQGDRVRVYVTNELPAPTSVHWHGLILPCGMDGVSGLSQPAIPPGETWVYEFTVRQHGTFMYHSHHDEMIQIALGMVGSRVIHPRDPSTTARVDRDYMLMLQTWKLDIGAARPDPLEMTDFNLLTINGRAWPGTEPLVVRQADRVRVRMANMSAMDHHPMHLHGHHWTMTATDGGTVPPSARWPETTILVPVGSTRTAEFVADHLGDWPVHCHMTHHTMNQMGHQSLSLTGIKLDAEVEAKLQRLLPGYMTMGQTGMTAMATMGMPVPPNSTPMKGGPGPFGYIDMGGMFTILKVRPDRVPYATDPGWHTHPPDTVATRATHDAMRRDGL